MTAAISEIGEQVKIYVYWAGPLVAIFAALD
jgi:hypothetical protein